MCSYTAFTTHYRRGAEAERRDAQDEFHSAAQARAALADGDFDADHGLAFDGAGRPFFLSRARGPVGVEAAAVRAPLLCKQTNKKLQNPAAPQAS
jgi:hypothetical protein